VPAMVGGHQGSFAELGPAVAALGEGCTATAWCASLSAHVGRFAGHLPAEGQRELWADGPDALGVASLTPLGEAEAVPGGYRLSGTWPFISAVDFADYALLAAVAGGGDGPAHPRIFAVPRGSWRTVDTWRNMGMAATGSNTVVVEDVLVPADRTVSREDLFQGRAAASDAPCHAVPMQATTMMFAVPALGAARGALRAWTDHVTPKIRAAAGRPPALPGMPTFNRTSLDVVLARAGTAIDGAALLLDRAAATVDDPGALTPRLTMRTWRDCAVATTSMVGVADDLFRTVGTSGQALHHAVQRFWRDIHSVAGHQALQVESAATAWSAAVLEV
jgi:alkylation response protein AidB-like acyl-CoA dehydrogenase